MASNLECEITEGESPNPDNPNPWQVQMRFFDASHNLVRTWTVDAPSELVAKTIETALTIMTDQNYEFVYNDSAVH